MAPFRLQAVLNVRKLEEEKLQGELSKLMRSIQEAERKLNFLRFQKIQNLRVLRSRQEEGLSGAEQALYDTYIREISKNISSQREVIVELNLLRDKKRAELITASKKRKILEKLKEKEIMEALREDQLRHQNFMDEMGVTRHASRVRELERVT